jgi:hypothetical protein
VGEILPSAIIHVCIHSLSQHFLSTQRVLGGKEEEKEDIGHRLAARMGQYTPHVCACTRVCVCGLTCKSMSEV